MIDGRNERFGEGPSDQRRGGGVVDDNTLGYWNRGGGTTAKNMSDGGKVLIFFRNTEIRDILKEKA